MEGVEGGGEARWRGVSETGVQGAQIHQFTVHPEVHTEEGGGVKQAGLGRWLDRNLAEANIL